MSIGHIAFIRPNLRDMPGRDAMEPLVFAILAGQTPPGISTVLYDDRLETIPDDLDTDLVAITVETFTARRAYQIARKFTDRGIPVVMGGFHATLMPEEVGKHCDAVVIGDAEGIWERVVKDADAGKLQKVYQNAAPPSLENLVFDRSIFKGKKYAPLSLVQFGRGCRFACEFCSIIAFYGRHRATRPVDDVVREIQALPRKLVFFVDDNLFSSRESLETLFDALKGLDIRWIAQISIDIIQHEDLLEKMAQSGCFALLIGFESLQRDNLKQMGKGWARRHQYETAVKTLRRHRILLYGTFVFGYDQDTPADFQSALEFATENRLFLANFNPLTPTPKTPLFERLASEGRLLHPRWWLDPQYRYGRSIFQPKGLSPAELEGGVRWARGRFYRLGNIFRRAVLSLPSLWPPYKIWIYGLANLISRMEITRKQDAPLGDPTLEIRETPL